MEQPQRTLYEEIGELTRYVDTTLRQLNAGMPVTSTQLSQASDHLTDLTRLTEEGTHTVMGLTEAIQDNRALVKEALRELAGLLTNKERRESLMDQVTTVHRIVESDDKRLLDIMTALSFQDLVGQRVAKIVTILDDVQHKLLEIVVTFGLKREGVQPPANGRASEMLKQLEASRSTALKQNLVDDILGEFGFH
ncbi:MAG: protein phosphatase CheZ [Nitrospiraceae bacterium]